MTEHSSTGNATARSLKSHAKSRVAGGRDPCFSVCARPSWRTIMERPKTALRRCAIYTRKSSEEGLEQDFNSLHAQREACEAFIQSQRGEGWRLVKTAYDDGGLSGATMERPGLQRLLVDIGQSLIDVVVVYKVDRLTRSLADFAKMVELFDARGGVVRRGHAAVQHHHLDGTPDAQRAAVVRAVRTGGHRLAHPRQDRRLQAQGGMDGWGCSARLRRPRAPPRD